MSNLTQDGWGSDDETVTVASSAKTSAPLLQRPVVVMQPNSNGGQLSFQHIEDKTKELEEAAKKPKVKVLKRNNSSNARRKTQRTEAEAKEQAARMHAAAMERERRYEESRAKLGMTEDNESMASSEPSIAASVIPSSSSSSSSSSVENKKSDKKNMVSVLSGLTLHDDGETPVARQSGRRKNNNYVDPDFNRNRYGHNNQNKNRGRFNQQPPLFAPQHHHQQHLHHQNMQQQQHWQQQQWQQQQQWMHQQQHMHAQLTPQQQQHMYQQQQEQHYLHQQQMRAHQQRPQQQYQQQKHIPQQQQQQQPKKKTYANEFPALG